MTTGDAKLLRLDKWLWAARFYKTRSLAAKAVSAGRVSLNGRRVKPANPIRVDDELQLQRGHETWIVIVLALSARRGPASVAATMYAETPASREAREAQHEQRHLVPHTGPDFRPDKRQRRALARVRRLLDD